MRPITQPKRIDPNSPLWPLPEDYWSLSDAGQAEARVHACLQYLLPGLNAEDRAYNYMRCLTFFDDQYLIPARCRVDEHGECVDPDPEWDCGFYDMDPLPSSYFHHRLAYLHMLHPAVSVVCPRGFGKTTLMKKMTYFDFITQRAFKLVYATSSRSNASRFGSDLRSLMLNNSRMRADFDPYYPDNNMVPGRREGEFSTQRLTLTDHSAVEVSSVGSSQRGMRPLQYILDDPEKDAAQSTSMAAIREDMEQLLFRVIEPMITRPGARIMWPGTFVSPQHYLWHAHDRVENSDGTWTARDPRFNSWYREIVDCYRSEDEAARFGISGGKKGGSRLTSVWPYMWPTNNAQKKELGCHPETKTLVYLEKRWGRPVFDAEMRGKPGAAASGYLKIDTDPIGPDAYTIKGADDYIDTPLKSYAHLSWDRYEKDGSVKPITEEIAPFLWRARPFIVADTSVTEGSHSDFKCCLVFVKTDAGDILLLDGWAEQCHESLLYQKIFELAEKWGCRSVWPEYNGRQTSLYDNLKVWQRESIIETEIPFYIRKLNMGMATKSSRIANLRVWFDHHLIKFPLYRRGERWLDMLLDQLFGFSPTVKNGGLKHDDCVDTAAMVPYVLKAAPAAMDEEEYDGDDPLENLRRGITHDKNGVHYGTKIDWTRESIPGDVLERIFQGGTANSAGKRTRV